MRMISLPVEAKILKLLRKSGISIGEVARQAGVARSTVGAVRDNRESRALTRAATKRRTLTRAAIVCDDNWVLTLKLERLLGQQGDKFVRIVRDVINIDSMRVIHHPLFASLVKQSRDALKVLPDSPKERQ